MVGILETIIAGLGGTALMTLLMTIIHRSGWARADMIRALGSLITRSYSGSLPPGVLLHSAAGAILAFPYALVLGGLDVSSTAAMIGLGALIGFVHGFVMGFILVAAVSENHPVKQFQEAGFEVAAAHVLGHLAYGIGVGAIIGLMSIDLGFRF
ncbi:MAG: hypothetical protein ACE5EO_02425 [Candidatus Krumholzibacteriia bacterium]